MVEVNKVIRILSLDPATTTGWSILEVSTEPAAVCIIDYGFFVVDISSKYEGDHCLSMQQKVNELVAKWDVNMVCLENYYFSRNAKQGANKNVFLRASILMHCRSLKPPLHYEFISVFDWKKFICGRSTPPPDVKKIYKTTANKMMTIISLWDKYKIQFPNRFPPCPSSGGAPAGRRGVATNKATKPLVFKTDISDSIAIGIYFCFKHFFGLSQTDVPVMDCTNYYDQYNDNKFSSLLDYN